MVHAVLQNRSGRGNHQLKLLGFDHVLRRESLCGGAGVHSSRAGKIYIHVPIAFAAYNNKKHIKKIVNMRESNTMTISTWGAPPVGVVEISN